MKFNHCLICKSENVLNYTIIDNNKKSGVWYSCRCGAWYQLKNVDRKVFNEEYKKKYEGIKCLSDRLEYLRKIYVPFIEEMTYGRKFLDVGFVIPSHIEALKERGWIATGIDLMDNLYIKADFELYDFKINKYDFIFMGSVLESFDNPVEAINKAYKLLNSSGVMLITTACTDFMYLSGFKKFGHWNTAEHHIYMSRRVLEETLRVAGFDILAMKENYSQRFVTWHDLHCIAQKPYTANEQKDKLGFADNTVMARFKISRDKEKQNG